ncbi:unnamed protein product [Nyctereutes procyonoides]|uniref:(raccoon dog) hypothetical protein n=2 Tax=Canidae TaxID=9608 RepID=A0A811Y6X4_NYCPR|nr:unnamed protein product [Nyctereutes procyonoides]
MLDQYTENGFTKSQNKDNGRNDHSQGDINLNSGCQSLVQQKSAVYERKHLEHKLMSPAEL